MSTIRQPRTSLKCLRENSSSTAELWKIRRGFTPFLFSVGADSARILNVMTYPSNTFGFQRHTFSTQTSGLSQVEISCLRHSPKYSYQAFPVLTSLRPINAVAFSHGFIPLRRKALSQPKFIRVASRGGV